MRSGACASDHLGDGRLAVERDQHVESFRVEHDPERLRDQPVVVDHEAPCGAARHRSTGRHAMDAFDELFPIDRLDDVADRAEERKPFSRSSMTETRMTGMPAVSGS